MIKSYEIKIKGVVQGVGFRPFVYQLATSLDLNGEVYNDGSGVVININASVKELGSFLSSLRDLSPPLSRIDSISYKEIYLSIFDDFKIQISEKLNNKTTLLPPDLSICSECEKELFDPKNRRYLHPFITCTDCGVRYSIIKTLPYDRKNTSMSSFKMCKECESEYSDPTSRRYHAQPIGCHECGATLTKSIDEIVADINDGKIVAIKGVGGYHLVCDAQNDKAIQTLRERKNRPSKPFAVMVKDLDMAKEFAFVNDKESLVLSSNKRPIVILYSKNRLSNLVAPDISKIGLMLPYTPLHLLLLDKLNSPIIATSANLSDEPICTNSDEIKSLNKIYDTLLDHDREIINSCDDSVVMVVKKKIITLRRARGYAPSAIKLPFMLKKKILALGANQKSTVAIGFDDNVILSPHIGDLGSISSQEHFDKNIQTLIRLYDFNPDVVVCDKHPNYISTKYAKEKFENFSTIQHHYAHIAGVMAQKGIKERVLGVAFDGTGYGDDGTLWGGEFLVCDYENYERVAHLRSFKLLGSKKAIKEPRRVALSLLFDLFGKDAIKLDNPTIKAFSKLELETLYIAWQKGLNAPFSSSMGRLFDAISSLLGVVQVMSFEGESGMLLEEYFDESIKGSYKFVVKDRVIDFLPMVEELIDESDQKIAVTKFFNTIVKMIESIKKSYDLPMVLGGGVFQNRVLLKLLLEKFPDLIIADKIPPNDGSIALGQIATIKNPL
jgi:hydrogenase maturation protein HypF